MRQHNISTGQHVAVSRQPSRGKDDVIPPSGTTQALINGFGGVVGKDRTAIEPDPAADQRALRPWHNDPEQSGRESVARDPGQSFFNGGQSQATQCELSYAGPELSALGHNQPDAATLLQSGLEIVRFAEE